MRSGPSLRLVLLLAGTTVLLSGCFYSREIAHTRRDIEHAAQVDFDRGYMVSLGPLSLRTLSWLSRFVPEDDAQMAGGYLRELSRVKVGIYEVAHGFRLDGIDPARLPRFEKKGWQVAVRFREDDEMGWVLYRERRGTVRDLYVVVLSEDELVLARVQGRLDHLLARILADHTELTAWMRDR